MTHLDRRKLLTCRFGENRRSLHRPVQKLPAARLPTAFKPAAATPAFFRFPTSPTGPTAIEDAGTVLSSCLRHAAGAIRMVLGAFRQMKASDLSICRKPPAATAAYSRFPTSPTGSTVIMIIVLSCLKKKDYVRSIWIMNECESMRHRDDSLGAIQQTEVSDLSICRKPA